MYLIDKKPTEGIVKRLGWYLIYGLAVGCLVILWLRPDLIVLPINQ